MKKFVVFLTIITISGTSMPLLIAANSYQKTPELKRNKRGINGYDEIEASWNNIYASFTPNSWEEIKINYNFFTEKYQDNGLEYFQNWFLYRMNNVNSKSYYKLGFRLELHVLYDFRITENAIRGLAKNIWTHWDNYNDVWENSSKYERIRITCVWDENFSFRSVNIREDDNYFYPNLIFEEELNKNLRKDFNKTNLGVIEDDKDETILNAIHEQNPNLDISQFNIVKKSNFSFLNKFFFAYVKVKNNSKKYPQKIIKCSFINKDFLKDKILSIIGQENLFNNWILNFNIWKIEIQRQILEDVPKYGSDELGQALKRTWKQNTLLEFSNKIFSLNHILETIDNKLKIEELYEMVYEIQNDINLLKQQLSILKQEIIMRKMNKTDNTNLKTCAWTGGLVWATTAWIPVIGILVSSVAGTVSLLCDIANAYL